MVKHQQSVTNNKVGSMKGTMKGKKGEGNSMKKQQQQRTRKDGVVLSVEQFAYQKGVTKGLLSYKERKEQKRLHTAKALRQYKKIMKQEGYQPGTGASRKRKKQNNNNNDNSNEEEEKEKEISTHTDSNNKDDDDKIEESAKKRQRRKKSTNVHQKSTEEKPKGKKQKQHQQQQQQQQQKIDHEKERKRAMKKRKQRHKLLTQRTSKGQPIMKNIVHDILSKLQQQKKKNN